LSLVLLVLGLVASFFHLGRPERAWRAAARWRTSWLSREVIVLPLFMALVFLYGLVHYFGWTQPWLVVKGQLPVDASLLIGALGAVAAIVLFVSTAMIYASIRFLQEWHSSLTVANFLLFGLASGFMLAAAFSAWSGVRLVAFYGTWAVIFTAVAAVTRGAALYRNARIKHKSNLQTAIGVRHTKIQQKSMGFMGGSFNTREFFHGRSPTALAAVKGFFVLAVFVVPLALLGAAHVLESASLPVLAFAAQYLGLMAERWYFFAEARHPQNLYYQTAS
jgi:DMSO reductase anchor subunit